MDITIRDASEIDPNTLVASVSAVGAGKDHVVLYFKKPPNFTGTFWAHRFEMSETTAAKLHNALTGYFLKHPKPDPLQDRVNQANRRAPEPEPEF